MCCKPMTLYILAMLAACCCVLMSCVESSSINATLPSTASASGVISFDSGDSLIYVKTTRQLRIKIDSGRIDTLENMLLSPDTVKIVMRILNRYEIDDCSDCFAPNIIAVMTSGYRNYTHGYVSVRENYIVTDWSDDEHLSYRYGVGKMWGGRWFEYSVANRLQSLDTVVMVNSTPMSVDRFHREDEHLWYYSSGDNEPLRTWTIDLTKGKDIVQVQSSFILDTLYQGVFTGEEHSWVLLNHKKVTSEIIRIE